MQAGESISFNVLTSRTVRDLETETGEEQGPSGLPRVETFGFLEILQILVVGDHYKGVLSTLQPMPPLLQSELDGQQLPITHVVVLLRRGQFP